MFIDAKLSAIFIILPSVEQFTVTPYDSPDRDRTHTRRDSLLLDAEEKCRKCAPPAKEDDGRVGQPTTTAAGPTAPANLPLSVSTAAACCCRRAALAEPHDEAPRPQMIPLGPCRLHTSSSASGVPGVASTILVGLVPFAPRLASGPSSHLRTSSIPACAGRQRRGRRRGPFASVAARRSAEIGGRVLASSLMSDAIAPSLRVRSFRSGTRTCGRRGGCVGVRRFQVIICRFQRPAVNRIDDMCRCAASSTMDRPAPAA